MATYWSISGHSIPGKSHKKDVMRRERKKIPECEIVLTVEVWIRDTDHDQNGIFIQAGNSDKTLMRWKIVRERDICQRICWMICQMEMMAKETFCPRLMFLT